MTFDEWLTYGLEQNWIIAGCGMHDSLVTEEEYEAIENGDEPCIPVLRVLSI